jgi:hypothetical protein
MNANITRLHAHRFLFLLYLVFLADTARAAGIREILIPPDSSGPQISAQLWTPCAAPPRPITANSGAFRLMIKGVKDCAPLGKGLPLILISHGMYGDEKR